VSGKNVLAKRKINLSKQREALIRIAGGRIICRRCQAISKRSKEQCQSPAMNGKPVCRFHGGHSRGPTTQAGKARCAAAKIVHGQETRAQREQSRRISKSIKAASNMLAILEEVGIDGISQELIDTLLRYE
jgi:hypothetical protein